MKNPFTEDNKRRAEVFLKNGQTPLTPLLEALFAAVEADKQIQDRTTLFSIIASLADKGKINETYTLFAFYSGVRIKVRNVILYMSMKQNYLLIEGTEGQLAMGSEDQFVLSYEETENPIRIGFHSLPLNPASKGA